MNNFRLELIRRIYRAFVRLVKPGGSLSYFEYAWVRPLKMPFVAKNERRRLHQVGRLVGGYIDAHQRRETLVWWNVPPALVRHLILKPIGQPLDPHVAARLARQRSRSR